MPKHRRSWPTASSFEVDNHDDLFAIIEKTRQAQVYDADTPAALALGMKPFSEVMAMHCDRTPRMAISIGTVAN